MGWALVLAVGALPDDAADVAVAAGMLRAGLLCAATGAVMLAVYVGLLRLMRVTELADVTGPLLRRFRGGAADPLPERGRPGGRTRAVAGADGRSA